MQVLLLTVLTTVKLAIKQQEEHYISPSIRTDVIAEVSDSLSISGCRVRRWIGIESKRLSIMSLISLDISSRDTKGREGIIFRSSENRNTWRIDGTAKRLHNRWLLLKPWLQTRFKGRVAWIMAISEIKTRLKSKEYCLLRFFCLLIFFWERERENIGCF